MTDYYVDPDASGSDTGADWTNAWSTLQRAIDGTNGTQPAVGDTVYCAHGTGDDETLSVKIDVDGNEGSITTGWIKFIGVNSSHVNDGTRYIINGDSAAVNCLSWTVSKDYIFFENFEFKNATSTGVDGAALACTGIVFINCTSHNNGAHGWNIYFCSYGSQLIRCSAYLNSLTGFYSPRAATLAFCVSRDNSQNGMILSYFAGLIYGCVVFDNTHNGIDDVQNSMLVNSVIDNNVLWAIDRRNTTHSPVLIGNRITNNDTASYGGIQCRDDVLLYGWNYFEDNTVNLDSDALAEVIRYDGADTNDADNADTNEGYVSTTEGSEDYNLRSDASMRRVAIQLITGQ